MSDENGSGDGPYLDHGEALPASYTENRIVGLVRDPERLFVYWDVASDVRLSGRPVVVRVHCLSEERSYGIEPQAGADSWYLQVSSNRTYRVEIHEREASGELRLLASTEELTTPPRGPGESGAERPAEIVHATRHPVARDAGPTPVGSIPAGASPPPPPAPPTAPPSPAPVSVPGRPGGGFDYTRDEE